MVPQVLAVALEGGRDDVATAAGTLASLVLQLDGDVAHAEVPREHVLEAGHELAEFREGRVRHHYVGRQRQVA